MNRNSEGTDANVGVLQWRRGWDLFLVEIPRRILPVGVFDGRKVVLIKCYCFDGEVFLAVGMEKRLSFCLRQYYIDDDAVTIEVNCKSMSEQNSQLWKA